ncbi:gamma-glutamyl-gamma-aminobutyrate hydrolase family protein [Brevibacillus fluminis]|uniref:gamma-glutamyl-gamma-aminobutyrate hydrolase family protein n=1 Tax=Brevibacillus fluminis TaxID=511487 RepID=UPI003F8A38BE
MSTIFDGRKPIIGITPWRRDLPTFLGEKTDLYTLDPEYSNCIELAGGVPVILTQNLANIASYMELLDGLVVSGGGDVDPRSYGEENSGQSYDVNEKADEFEIALLREAAARRLPVLGICRGFQMMQVAFGGAMHQDLHSVYPAHPKNQGDAETILAQRHPVKLAEGSWLARAYGTTERIVNTIHHQCVRVLGDGFKPVGWSEDGIVEAVEAQTQWQAIGVQWHPEKLKNEAELGLFRAFIEGIEENKRKERS